MEVSYDFSTEIRNKNVKYRKWKVKDKKKFLNNRKDKHLIREALVFDCIEDKKLALSDEEYKFMLTQIRNVSVSDPISYTFVCNYCEKDFNFDLDLENNLRPVFKEYGDIISGDHIFTMNSIRSREHYEQIILNSENDDEKIIVDFILHVKSYNDSDGLSFEDLNQIIDNLDVNDFDSIFKQWEDMRFKLNNVSDVECPHCNNVESFEFDSLPGFFPESWNI